MPPRALQHPRIPGTPRRLGAALGRLTVAAALTLGLAPAAAASTAVTEPVTVTATANAMPDGTVELGWVVSSPSAVTGYEVHRSNTGQDFAPAPSTRLQQLISVTTYLDPTAEPGSSPWYRIAAVDGEGTTVATSAGVQAQIPAEPVDKQHTSVLSAFPGVDGVRLSWRAAADAKAPLTVYAGLSRVAEGKLAGAQRITASDTTRAAFTWDPNGGPAEGFALVDADGQVIATAVPARAQHPRLVTPGVLSKVRRIVDEPGTTKAAWQALLARVDTGGGSALDAAFAYAVTGQRDYAEAAFAQFRKAGAILRTQQGLEVGNTITTLAPAYDLAYSGWTPAQRSEAQRTFQHAAAYLGTFHHANIDNDADKASNWVVIIHGSELLMHLAARGDGDYGLREQRIPVLVDEIRRNLDEAYGDSGWDQEGHDYLSYTLGTLRPTVTAVQNAGLRALDSAWKRPAFAELEVRSQSLRPTAERLQSGVGEVRGGLTPQLLGTGSPEAQAAYRWLFERTAGHLSVDPAASAPSDPWLLINWPEYEAEDPDSFPELRTALLDDKEGGYAFRNRVQGSDDVLVGVTNRNTNHMGWSQPESFGLNLIGQGTTWARQPAKESTTYSLFSKPLIDGKAIPAGVTPGGGSTRASRAYAGQGGGFVSLEAAKDYGIDSATREAAIDLRPIGGADAVIALHDHFADDNVHRIDWQLSPETGVRISHGEEEAGAQTFLLQREDAWLKGWLLDPSDATMSTSNGAFRITRTGTSADFRVVLATGRGAIPTAKAEGSTLTLGTVAYDTSTLSSFVPASSAPGGNSTRPTVYLSAPSAPFLPGVTRSVTAQYTWWGDRPAKDVQLSLEVPEGWTARQLAAPATATLRTGERATASYEVTAPAKGAAYGDSTLVTTASASGVNPISDSAPVSLIRTNLALAKPAEQSSTQGPASRAVDGNIDGIWGHGSVAHTLQEPQPWWQVDLGASQELGAVTLWNRVDCCAQRLHDFHVFVSDQPFGQESLSEVLARDDVWTYKYQGIAGRNTMIPVGAAGRYVRIQLDDPAGYLILAEVQVTPIETDHLAQGQPATQSSTAEGAEAALAVNGDIDGAGSSTQAEVQPWWQTDLGESLAIGRVELWNAVDAGAAGQPTQYYVLVSDTPFVSGSLSQVLAQPGVTAYKQTGAPGRPTVVGVGKGGRHVRIQAADPTPTALSLTEVRVTR